MRKKLLILTATLFLIIIFTTSLTLKVNNSNGDVDLYNLAKIATAQAEDYDPSCGTGYEYFCTYFEDTGLQAYEGPYYAK